MASFHEQVLELYDWLQPPLAQVTLVDAAGRPIQMRGVADVFETDRSHYRASPMPLLGTVTLDSSADSLVIDSNRYPKSVQVRIQVPGYGMDYISVELNRRHTWTLRLGPPTEVSGIVLDQTGAPVPGARVIVLGGSNRGVELARTLTQTDGKYTAHGISRNVDFLTLRVLKAGFALEEREHWLDASPGEKASQTDFKLVPVPPVLGELRLPNDVDATGLHISVAQLAGVRCSVDPDGRFVLHHLSADRRYRVLVQGLPDGFTHRRTYVEPGGRVQIDVLPCVTLRGQVVSERLGRPLANVGVWHSHSTRGQEHCVTDKHGHFELRRVPIGDMWLNIAPPQEYYGGKSSKRLVEVQADPGVRVRVRIR